MVRFRHMHQVPLRAIELNIASEFSESKSPKSSGGNGFRDIDVQDDDGRTPLMLSRSLFDMDLATEIDVCS